MAYENIIFETKGSLAEITVNRPRRLNAINTSTILELLDAAKKARDDSDTRVVVFTGTGQKSFVAGADVTELEGKDYLGALEFSKLGQKLCATFENMEKPVLAAISGYALGAGCELAVACDFAYASTDAIIGMPEVNLGIIPGFGGTQRLLRRVPVGIARELVLSGQPIDAEKALRIGLVNALFPPDELMQKTREMAMTIAQKGPLAIARAKRLMVEGPEMPLTAANTLEWESFGGLFATEDKKEGMRAFLEKRDPDFKGR